MHHYIADIVVKRVTVMTTNELVAVSQDRNSSDEMATKAFLIA